MAAIAVVFDFDQTIIDGDSDRWVVTEMGLTSLFTELRGTLPWTSLMDRMMKELHSQGIKPNDIIECLKRAVLHPSIIAAIKSAHALGCDLRVVSDANMFFIETILEYHGLLGCFSEVNSNPTHIDEEGRLHIAPFHDSNMSPHYCHLCPSNMCKGLVLSRIRSSTAARSKQRFIYIGDGTGDYCPTIKLSRSDFVMPRKNFPLWNRIRSDPTKVNAEVHEWNSGQELEQVLLSLIHRITIEEAAGSSSKTPMSSGTKFRGKPFSTGSAVSQTHS